MQLQQFTCAIFKYNFALFISSWFYLFVSTVFALLCAADRPVCGNEEEEEEQINRTFPFLLRFSRFTRTTLLPHFENVNLLLLRSFSACSTDFNWAFIYVFLFLFLSPSRVQSWFHSSAIKSDCVSANLLICFHSTIFVAIHFIRIE